MDRRGFMASAAAGAAVMGTGTTLKAETRRGGDSFSMHFAPHFGMFSAQAGNDPVAQLEFAADAGFTAWEDNGMKGRSVEDQERIASAMDRLGMQMGVFVMNMGTAWGETFSRGDRGDREKFVNEAKESVEVAKRVNATWMTVVLGTRHPRIDLGYQTAYCVDQLRAAAEVLEPHGLVMVLEPLNPRDHPNMLLSEMGHAYEICRA
ncbi:MAG: TIM barrel protein, partial [Phycisphaerales bacterium]